MRTYRLDLTISPAELERYYANQARWVVAKATSGETLRFDARHLRPHVTPIGIAGRFELTTDDQNRFLALKRL